MPGDPTQGTGNYNIEDFADLGMFPPFSEQLAKQEWKFFSKAISSVILALLFLCYISIEATKPEDAFLMFWIVVQGLLSPPQGASVPAEELQHLLVFIDSSFIIILLLSTSEMKNFA